MGNYMKDRSDRKRAVVLCHFATSLHQENSNVEKVFLNLSL